MQPKRRVPGELERNLAETKHLLPAQAEVIGCTKVIYVKDEDGMYDKDPKVHDDAKPYRNITLDELLANPPETNMLDASVFTSWKTAKNIQRLQIVNGLKKGELTKALAGEDAGTVITKE